MPAGAFRPTSLGRALVIAPMVVSLCLASAGPSAADPHGRWHRDGPPWHHHRGDFHHERGSGTDLGAALALGLIAGMAATALSRPSPRPVYRYADPGYGYQPTYLPPPSYAPPSYAPPVRAYAPAPRSPLSLAFNSQDRQLRMAIQQELQLQGYYNAGLDGLWGPGTQGALYAYARDHGQLGMIASEVSANRLFTEILSDRPAQQPPVGVPWVPPGET